MIAYAKEIATKITDLENKKLIAQDQITKLTSAMEDMGHFVGLHLDLDEINACEYVNVRFGSLTKENYAKLSAYKDNPNVIFTPCAADEKNQWGLYFAPIEGTSEADRIFHRPEIPKSASRAHVRFSGKNGGRSAQTAG